VDHRHIHRHFYVVNYEIVVLVLQHPYQRSCLHKKYKAQAHDLSIQKTKTTTPRWSAGISESSKSTGFF